ncbi:MAG: UDP-2,4-diacetamido-2,4,6-trideoxy-beta-L-altropyranose hydrolase [Desulfobacula sp.]|nr:UDP-2,4-diacetamido-2,4,6-trideoxy-beta-L-altropyranose hydrolase [Desulfobacula sp.]
MNHLFIRSDATKQMGTGHIMRCIALAQAWKKRSELVTFISHCPNHKISKRIESEGFNLIKIDKIWPHSQDLKKTLKVLNNLSNRRVGKAFNSHNWVIIDGYHFTPDYQKNIMEAGFKLLVIDDNNHLDHYNANILLNQNIGSSHYPYSCNQNTKELLGTKYAMLRSEFLMSKHIKKVSPAKAKNILVTMGGADPDNTTLKIVQAINQINDSDLKFNIIVGPDNPNIECLKDASQNQLSNINLIDNADMPEMMAWADLCVTAGGSSCWELCFMEVPFIIIIIAANQIELTSRLEKAGVAINLGKQETLSQDDITQNIVSLSCDIKKRKKLKKVGIKIVDGKGTKRIIRQMLAGKFIIRNAGIKDAKLLYEQANDKKVRLSSFNSDPILWEEHLQWLRQKLKDENSWIFIAENHMGDPIGQIRFDRKDDLFEISYSLDKKFRGLGLGKTLLKIGLKTIQTKIHEPVMMQGSIKNDNISSKISFENCGFAPLKNELDISTDSNHLIYQLLIQPTKSLEKS